MSDNHARDPLAATATCIAAAEHVERRGEGESEVAQAGEPLTGTGAGSIAWR